MSEESLKRAKCLHKELFVADAHYDLLNFVASKRIEKKRTGVIAADYLDSFRAGGVDLLICSLFLDDCHVPEMALRRALDQISCLHEEMDESGELALCRSTSEIKAAKAAGKLAILLSFEGVEPLGSDLRLLRVFYELGVRGVGLTWSRRNCAADGCSDDPRKSGKKGGLSEFGVALVKKCEQLGMYIDVSHLNDEGFWDVCKVATKPFMASHSNCRSITDVARNLTDMQIRALAERGGIMGLNSCGDFLYLSDDDEEMKAGPYEMASHGSRVKKLVGAKHLCFGFDFCDEMRANAGEPPLDAVEFYDHAYELTAALIDKGFSEEELAGVLGGNIMSFLEKTIG